MLSPLTNNILFVFVDNIVNGRFVDTSSSGIYLGNGYDDTIKRARWGKVVAVGPTAKREFSVGDEILITPLMWTEGFSYDGVQIWKTNAEQILAIRE